MARFLRSFSPTKLSRLAERLETYSTKVLERDIKEFAKGEAAVEDPVQARRVGSGANPRLTPSDEP